MRKETLAATAVVLRGRSVVSTISPRLNTSYLFYLTSDTAEGDYESCNGFYFFFLVVTAAKEMHIYFNILALTGILRVCKQVIVRMFDCNISFDLQVVSLGCSKGV